MKTHPWFALAVAGTLALGSTQIARAGLFTDDFEMLVVAESAKDAPANILTPTTYCAVDGGYIEGGDAIAGDTPPTADRVRQELYDALRAEGFEANRTSPNILLTYYWGVLRRDREEIRHPYGVKYNQDARIRLVSTEALGDEVENHILGRLKAPGTNDEVSSPPILVGPTATVVQNARLPRFFVIISAYDYQGLTRRHESKPVWRVKLSAQETSGAMDEVIPALIEKGAPYFGKNLQNPTEVKATLSRGANPASTPASSLQPSSQAELDPALLQSILNRERIEFTGLNPVP
jgi:hypothetical protein